MMAVTSFLRWPLERVVHGDECVVSAGSGEDMEFCNCSANSSKASGSVKAKVSRVDGKGLSWECCQHVTEADTCRQILADTPNVKTLWHKCHMLFVSSPILCVCLHSTHCC